MKNANSWPRGQPTDPEALEAGPAVWASASSPSDKLGDHRCVKMEQARDCPHPTISVAQAVPSSV